MKAEGKKKLSKTPLKRNVRLLNTEVLEHLKFYDRLTLSGLAMMAPKDFYIISNFRYFFPTLIDYKPMHFILYT